MTFSELIEPIRSQAILACVATSATTIAKWRSGAATPEGWQIFPLADLLRMDAGELARVVYEDRCGK